MPLDPRGGRSIAKSGSSHLVQESPDRASRLPEQSSPRFGSLAPVVVSICVTLRCAQEPRLAAAPRCMRQGGGPRRREPPTQKPKQNPIITPEHTHKPGCHIDLHPGLGIALVSRAKAARTDVFGLQARIGVRTAGNPDVGCNHARMGAAMVRQLSDISMDSVPRWLPDGHKNVACEKPVLSPDGVCISGDSWNNKTKPWLSAWHLRREMITDHGDGNHGTPSAQSPHGLEDADNQRCATHRYLSCGREFLLQSPPTR